MITKDSGRLFTKRGDLLKLNAHYNSSVRKTPDAKSVFDFLSGMNFIRHLKNRSSRAKTPEKTLFKKYVSTCIWIGISPIKAK